MFRRLVTVIGLSCALLFGACACSFSSSSESTSTLETSTTDEDGNTTTTKTTTDSDGTSTTETTTSLSMGDWTDVWMGATDKGYDVYYAEAPDGAQAFLVLHNEDADDTESFIGDTENPEEGLVTVHGQGAQFTFQIVETDESLENLTIFFGDDYGTADLKACSLDDLVAGVHAFDPEGNILEV